MLLKRRRLWAFGLRGVSKWYKSAADDAGIDVSDAEARERVYGMPYEEWKEKHQLPATPEQMAAFEARK